MSSSPRILLLSATTGYQLRSFNDAAARRGVELTFATDRCHALDDPWQDDAIPVRFHEEEASLELIVQLARQRPFAGVVAVGDRPTPLAAAAARALDLPWHSVEGARACGSKLESRRRFAAAGLITPWLRVIGDTEAAAAVCADPQVSYPCVIKPTGLSGSRGVIRADAPGSLELAIGRVRALLTRRDVQVLRRGSAQTLIVEGFITGREYAIEGVMSRGRLQPLAIFDKPDPLDGPFFEETIYVTPPALDEHRRQAIVGTVERAALALGLWHGPLHAECRVNSSGVVMLEVAARPIGGLCSKVLRFEGGTALEELLLEHALGGDVSGWRREQAAAAVMMIPIPKDGRLRGWAGEAAALAVPGVAELNITAKPDQLLERLPEAGSYLGFLFGRGALADEAEAAVRAGHRCLSFQIESPIAVAPL